MSKPTEIEYPVHSLVASEIAQQPVLWPDTLERVISASGTRSFGDLSVILTGAGTSGYAAMAIADAWPGARAIPTTDLLLQSATEIELAVPSFSKNGLLISLARSGDSPESVGVVERMRRFFPSAQHLAIVCNAEGRLARIAGVECICLDPRTNDRSLAMTGSFSNLVLGGLAVLHAQRIGSALIDICSDVARNLTELNAIAQKVAGWCGDRIVVLASCMRALAWEASLKIVELTAGRVMAVPESFLGLRHGLLSFLRKDTPIVCFASAEATRRRYEEDLIRDLKQKGLGKVIVVGNDECAHWQHDWFVPAVAWNLPDSLRTPFEVVFAQLLAFHLSAHVNVDPDNPSPDGTITRVVKPFALEDV